MPLPRGAQRVAAAAEVKTFEVDCAAHDLYSEFQRALCPAFEGFGRNDDALWDVLRGGFGAFAYGERVRLVLRRHAALPGRVRKLFEACEQELGHSVEWR
jgi:hypothetical protein